MNALPFLLCKRRPLVLPPDLRAVSDEEVLRAVFACPDHFAAMQFGVPFETVAVTSTAKTVAGVLAPTNQAVKVVGLYIGFDGTNSGNAPGIVEVGSCTFATNGPGTNSTSVTPAKLDTGRPETIQSTAAKNWSTEPTVITVQEAFLIPVYMGAGMIFRPMTVPLICAGGKGAVIRVTLPSAVTANATGTLLCEE